MEVQLKIKDDLYGESTDGGKTRGKLIKKNIITSLTINTNDILSVSDILSNKGSVLKNFCRIHIREVGPVIVNHSHEYINKIKQHNARPIGFQQRSKQRS